jgi:hypothetical protein
MKKIGLILSCSAPKPCQCGSKHEGAFRQASFAPRYKPDGTGRKLLVPVKPVYDQIDKTINPAAPLGPERRRQQYPQDLFADSLPIYYVHLRLNTSLMVARKACHD